MNSVKLSRRKLLVAITIALCLVLVISYSLTQPANAQQTHNVAIFDFAFQPRTVTIQTGDTISWLNNDPVIYTLWFVYAENKTTYQEAGSEGLSQPILPGESWSDTFDEPVTLQYYSFERLWITGFITVQPQPPPPPANLEIYFYATQADAFAALSSCEVDFMQDPLTLVQYTAVVGDPKIQVAPCTTDVGLDYYGYKKHLVGVVSMDNQGLENSYTFLHAYKIDDPGTPVDEASQPIKVGTSNPPLSLNVLYANTPPDLAVLDRIYPRLLSLQPYRLEMTQPWVAQDWEVDTWFNQQTSEDATKVTYYIRKDVGIVAPETGQFVRNYNAHDVEFTIWYIYAFADSVLWNLVMDVHHICVTDDYTIEVYFDITSEGACEEIGLQMPLLPKYELLPLLCEERMVEFHVDEPIDPCTKFPLPTDDQIIQVINCTKDGTIPLTEYVDFQIVASGEPDYIHNLYHTKIPLEPCQTIQIWYWTPVADPHGYYLAGLPWEQTMYSIGTHYPVHMNPEVGGWALLNSNPTFFIEPPPLGEIDWLWTWSTHPTHGPLVPGRDSGYYQVFLYDAVKVSAAYGSRGDGVPSLNWFPGADIDKNWDYTCWVFLYDAVEVSGKYGTKFGIPLP